MGKASLRFPESAVAGGRFGTARVRGAIADAASQLRSTEHVELDAPIARMVGDARTTHRALGRLGGGRMNKTETAYAELLAARRHIGEVLWFRFEGIKLRLADRTFYTPDFAVLVASGALELHEVKGFMEEDAAVKLKSAASQYPFVVRLIRRAKGGEWDIREI